MRLMSLVCLVLSLVAAPAAPATTLPSRIAFGSCNLQLRPQDFWTAIADLEPDVWIWMGDNIYADFLKPASREREYNRIKAAPGYQRLKARARILGTWDDHDYGYDGAGADYPLKKISQKLALDFLEEPDQSPRRLQEGIYAAYDLGDSERSVKVVLLDMRYQREPAGENGDPLGEEQWKWLEGELLQSKATLTLVVSGNQVIPLEMNGDKWQDFPRARARLLGLAEASPSQVLFLSGDIHSAEMSSVTLGKRTVFEVTSSGLTHASLGKKGPRWINSHRVGPPLVARNFGTLELDWKADRLDVSMQLRTIDGEVFYEHPLSVPY